jgi:hypothetical protein
MMEIAIFKEITTEGVIASIEENSKKYHDGLYADMDNLPERTMVKKGAAEIGDIIKLLKTSRIAITKANTAAVNKEHDAIVARLELANKPFTDLLDAYNVKRKLVLDSENARKQAIIDLDVFNRDHEMALLIDKTYAYDQEQLAIIADKEEKRIEKERDEYAAQQVKLAEEKQIAREQQSEQDEINAENARLANVEHVRGVNIAIRDVLIDYGFSDHEARLIVRLAVTKELPQLTINY